MSRKRPLTQTTLDNLNVSNKKKKTFCSQPVNTSGDYEEKQAGTISHMILKNFMCHTHLEVNFTKNINYIVGKNGSGKSAILTALVVGLSGRATATNRGNSIKSFIKAGKNSGSVEITLYNTGADAYKPSIYGDGITVVRNVTTSGSSSYKTKSSLGQVISHSVKEIQTILSYFNIQIDNPLCILNQDTSRNFLSSSDPKQKFTLFMRATGLEALKEEQARLGQNLHELKTTYTTKHKLYKSVEKQMETLKTKMESHKAIQALKKKFDDLAVEIIWATVCEFERRLEHQEGLVAKSQKTVDKYVDMNQNRGQREEEIKAQATELEQQILEIKQNHEAQSRPLQDLDKQIRRLKEQCMDKTMEKKEAARNVTDAEKNMQILRKEIENYTNNLSKMEQEKIQRKEQISVITEKIKNIHDATETTQNEMFQLRGHLHKIEEEEKDLGNERKQLMTQFESTKSDLANLKSQSNNTLYLYGRHMPQVVEAIKANQHRFSKMPKGPLGSYITIKDKKWSVAVEGFLGAGLLQAFTVDNANDNKVLIDIFNKNWTTGKKPTIITTKFSDRIHNVKPNLVEAPRDCVSLYNAIEVKDHVVMNCLIDQSNIEHILLLPSAERAMELLSEVRRVPRNCRQGVTIKGDQFYPDPNYRTYSSNYRNARYLQVDKAELISQTEDKLREIHLKLKSVDSQVNSVILGKRSEEARLQEIITKKDNLKHKSLRLKKSLDELQNSDEPEALNYQSLEEEMTLLKNSIVEKNVRVKQIDSDVLHMKDDISKLEDQKKIVMKNIQNLQDRIAPLQNELTRLEQERNDMNINGTFQKKRIQEAKSQLVEAQEKLRRIKSEVDAHITLGGGEEKRIHTERSSRELQEEATKTTDDIRKLSSETGNIGDIAKEYKSLVDHHIKSTSIISSIEKNVYNLFDAEKKRSRHYKSIRDYYTQFVDHNFEQILAYRQFKGRINIDYSEKQLNMVVVPQQGSQGHTATTNLSGGERSFSTVAFLYSLWQILNFPFYFLDEFDVFMDKINRCKVMEILIHHARQKPDLQYVFLTPQDISFIHDKDIAIHRLEDPERRQID